MSPRAAPRSVIVAVGGGFADSSSIIVRRRPPGGRRYYRLSDVYAEADVPRALVRSPHTASLVGIDPGYTERMAADIDSAAVRRQGATVDPPPGWLMRFRRIVAWGRARTREA